MAAAKHLDQISSFNVTLEFRSSTYHLAMYDKKLSLLDKVRRPKEKENRRWKNVRSPVVKAITFWWKLTVAFNLCEDVFLWEHGMLLRPNQFVGRNRQKARGNHRVNSREKLHAQQNQEREIEAFHAIVFCCRLFSMDPSGLLDTCCRGGWWILAEKAQFLQ